MDPISSPDATGSSPVAEPSAGPPRARSGGPSLALLLVLAAGFVPLLVAFGLGIWSKPAYRFFPAGLLAAGCVCWLGARRESSERFPGPLWLTALLLGASLSALAAATVIWSPWVGAVAATVAVLGVANWVGGPTLLKAWLPGWLILLTILPAPMGLDERLLGKLRTMLVTLARPLLGQYDVLHVVRADSLEVPGRVVPLADACAGLYLIPASMALALVLTTMFRRGWLHGLVVALTMPAWAFLGALVWLVAGLKLASGGGVFCFGGLAAAGVVVLFLIVMAGMALSMDQFVRFWTAPSRGTSGARWLEAPPQRARRLVAPSRLGWAAALAFALLGVAQTGLGMRGILSAPPSTVLAPLPARAFLSLPPEIGGWRVFTNHFSALEDLVTPTAGAQTWHYVRGELAASITLEPSLAGYHSLVANYLAAGWRLLRVAGVGDGQANSAPFVVAELQKDIFQYGRVWFAVGETSGKWLAAPRPAGRSGPLKASTPASSPATFRIQLFVGSLEPLTPAEVESAEALFQTVRQQLAAQLTGQPFAPNAPAQPQ
jgi:hypothetical protein